MSLEGCQRLKAWLVIGGCLSIGFAALATTGHVSAASDDYPPAWQGAMDSMLDSWGYYNRECVSFVAWRLHARNGFEMPRAIGNGGTWGSWASAHGYAVNMTPAVGSVAWFSNHVAWVESVGSGSVTIEDYNGVDSNHNGIYGDDGTYNERTIMTNSVSGYIHFRDLGMTAYGLSFIGGDHLNSNQILQANQYVLSPDVRFFLVMQTDGNLVLYGPSGRAYWSSNTAGSGASYAIMQGDGNLVLYRANGAAAWASNTAGRGSSSFYIQNDGNSVIYSSGGATWASNTGGHQAWSYANSEMLNTNQTLNLNRYLRSSNKKYALALQDDGNLVLYTPGYHVLWSAGISNVGAAYALMQSDGNLVLYTNNWRPVWASNTGGTGSAFLYVQDDGNLVIYINGGSASWASNTAGRI